MPDPKPMTADAALAEMAETAKWFRRVDFDDAGNWHAALSAEIAALRERVKELGIVEENYEELRIRHEKDRSILVRAMVDNEKIWRARLEAAGLEP